MRIEGLPLPSRVPAARTEATAPRPVGSNDCWSTKNSPGATPPAALPRKSSPGTPPSSGISAKHSPSTRKHAECGVFWARWAKNFSHSTHKQGDIETNSTTARPQHGTSETGITSAPENCTKNAHFSPAQAMAVSIPHGHKRAKAMAVSDHRAIASAAPTRGTRGRRPATTSTGSGGTTASQMSRVIYRGHFSRHPTNVAIPTMKIQCVKDSSKNYVRNCWLAAAARLRADAPSHTSTHQAPLV